MTGDLAAIVATFLTATPKAAARWDAELTADDPAPRDDPPVPVWVFGLAPVDPPMPWPCGGRPASLGEGRGAPARLSS